jgi:hypothetical protein
MCRSEEFLDRWPEFDFAFIDGDHTTPTVRAELDRLLVNPHLQCLMAHDTSAAGRYDQCDGSPLIKHEFQKLGWFCCEDALYRDGERTERGLFMAARTPELYAVGLEGYRSYC